MIQASELSAFEYGDGYSAFRYGVRALRADGWLSQPESFLDPKVSRFDDDSCVAPIEETIAGLIGRDGKQEAPDEFAARVAVLRGRARSTQSTWRAYEIEAESASGTVLDKAALDAAGQPLAEAVAAVEAARAERVTGEYRAAAAAPTSADPNPKADFYSNQSRSLDAASSALHHVDDVIASGRIPYY